ncbi:hypothetical protein BC936DRAFT_139711, partial [Jimgerdemannia flammicorona]
KKKGTYTRTGKYAAKLDDEFFLDQLADIANDWRMFWGFRIFENCEEFNRKYDDVERPKFLRAFETLYGQRKGDFAMGDEVTYVDFLVYQLLLDEGGASTLTVSISAGSLPFEPYPDLTPQRPSIYPFAMYIP